MHNYPTIRGQVIAEFLDADSVLLDSIAPACVTSGWVEVVASGAAPPSARQVRITLRAVLVADSAAKLACRMIGASVVALAWNHRNAVAFRLSDLRSHRGNLPHARE